MADKKRKRNRKRSSQQLMERIEPNAGGVDCGATSHYVAVPVDRDEVSVREFSTFTNGLQQLVVWLQACGVTTVAMESTGVYWIALYDMLLEAGITPVLVNAHHVKNVPGRKSDVQDCEWLRDLHSVGLLRGSFRPDAEIVSLRSYLRQRETLTDSAADQVRRMQKALLQMNLHLHHAITDITGVTGMAIVRAIVDGEHDPKVLASFRDRRCKASQAEIEAALTGHYRVEYLFVLRQCLTLYDVYQQHIAECDHETESLLHRLAARQPAVTDASLSTPPKRTPLSFDPILPLQRMTGTDLTRIDGIAGHAALQLVAEIGTDMSRWRTPNHFTSWLGLAPCNRISGNKRLSSTTQPSRNRAAAILRMSAMSLARSSTALGAHYRRLAYRIGKAKAITATARKLAILVYRALSGTLDYRDPGADAYDAQHRQRAIRNIKRRAHALGMEVVDAQPA